MPEEVFETPQPVQPTEPKSIDWTKIILAAVFGLVLLAAAAYAGYWYGTESANLKNQISKQPFPLNDVEASYRINKSGQRFLLSCTKGGQTQKIYIGKSSVDLESYTGKEVSVEGKFRTEEEVVQCFRAPCPPAEVLVLDISDVRVK